MSSWVSTAGTVAAVAGVVTGLGALALAHSFVRWGRDDGDRRVGRVVGALAFAHATVPVVVRVVTQGRGSVAAVVAVASLAVSALLVLVVPVAIGAAARP